MFEDDEVEDDGATGEEDDLTESEFADEEDNFNIDDLLYSDEKLCYKWKYILFKILTEKLVLFISCSPAPWSLMSGLSRQRFNIAQTSKYGFSIPFQSWT